MLLYFYAMTQGRQAASAGGLATFRRGSLRTKRRIPVPLREALL